MLEMFLNPDSLTTLLTLSVMEIVLGIDNLVMIAILVSALPKAQQGMARSLGIGFALLTRVILLFAISWLSSLTEPLFSIKEHPFSARDLVLFFGGLFLLYKGGKELLEMRHPDHARQTKALGNNLFVVIFLIGLFDIVFSLDSVITAVGFTSHMPLEGSRPIMITAICIAMAVMLFASGPVIRIIEKHMEIKVIALCFLLLIGVMLMAGGLGYHIPKGYIYAAMGFSVFVQAVIIWVRESREKYTPEP